MLQVASAARSCCNPSMLEHSVVHDVSHLVPGDGPGPGVVLSSGVGTSLLQKSS